MSYMWPHFDCCPASEGSATVENQELVLAALAALTANTEEVKECIEEVKAVTNQPESC